MAATTAMATYRDSSWGTDGRSSSASTAPTRRPTKAAMSAVRRLGVVDGHAPCIGRHGRRVVVADGEPESEQRCPPMEALGDVRLFEAGLVGTDADDAVGRTEGTEVGDDGSAGGTDRCRGD